MPLGFFSQAFPDQKARRGDAGGCFGVRRGEFVQLGSEQFFLITHRGGDRSAMIGCQLHLFVSPHFLIAQANPPERKGL